MSAFEPPPDIAAGRPEPRRSAAVEDDPVLQAVDEVLRVARENMSNWLGVMERVEVVRELRRKGVPYAEMQIDVGGPSLIDVVARNQERLTAAAAHLRRTLAHALVDEGMSHADVARIFGVSRQRVGMLLRPDDGGSPATPVADDLRPDVGDGAGETGPIDSPV